MLRSAWCLLLWFGVLPPLQDEKDPEDVLTAYLKDMGKAIDSSNKDPDKRTRLLDFAKVTFTKDIQKAVPKSPKSAWDYVPKFLEHLKTANDKFGTPGLTNERTQWINACKALHQRQLACCKEKSMADADFPGADKVFAECYTHYGKVKNAFSADTVADLRVAGYQGVREAFTVVIAKAKVGTGTPMTWYDGQINRIDKGFPIDTESDKKVNSEPNTQLKACLKQALDQWNKVK